MDATEQYRAAVSDAAEDLNEALLWASDGTARLPGETLVEAIGLLLHGNEAGNFFEDFRALFAQDTPWRGV